MSLHHIFVRGVRLRKRKEKKSPLGLNTCLFNSFGNAARIDYGTGHENTFVAFLLCLYELGLVGLDDQKALVTRVFAKYISVMRRLQISYR